MNGKACCDIPFEKFNELSAGLWKPETLLLLYLASSEFKQLRRAI